MSDNSSLLTLLEAARRAIGKAEEDLDSLDILLLATLLEDEGHIVSEERVRVLMERPRKPNGDPIAVSVSGGLVKLRPVENTDFEFLYELAVDDNIGPRWRLRGQKVSREQFMATLTGADVAAQFVVESRLDGADIGHCVLYAVSERDGVGYAAVALRSVEQYRGCGSEAAALLLGYAFSIWPLRKVYFEVPEYNMPSLASAIGGPLLEEGVLAEHVFHGGRYWDMHLLSVSRAAAGPWLQLHDSLTHRSTRS
jgi:RimJ/RimL family protein N-acetyltransferase